MTRTAREVASLQSLAQLGDEYRLELLDRGFNNEDADFIVALIERLDAVHVVEIARITAALESREREARRETWERAEAICRKREADYLARRVAAGRAGAHESTVTMLAERWAACGDDRVAIAAARAEEEKP